MFSFVDISWFPGTTMRAFFFNPVRRQSQGFYLVGRGSLPPNTSASTPPTPPRKNNTVLARFYLSDCIRTGLRGPKIPKGHTPRLPRQWLYTTSSQIQVEPYHFTCSREGLIKLITCMMNLDNFWRCGTFQNT